MVSYIKTQWPALLFAVVCFIISCIYFFSPAPDTTTLEGLEESMANMTAGYSWLISSLLWFVHSMVGHNTDCIQKLSERVEALEAKKND